MIIPTYNSQDYITETLKSVFLQNYDDFEVIVSDDGSSDNTQKTVRSIFEQFPDKRAMLIINSHQGPGNARNKGIEAACGKWISFLDSDDRWFPEKLQTVDSYLCNNKKVNLVCHSEIWRSESKETVLKYSELYDDRQRPFMSLYRNNAFSTSALTAKKQLLTKAGLFDTTLPSCQDYDFWLRISMLDEVRIGFIDEPLGLYVIRSGNISSNVEQRLRCLLRINKKYISTLKQISKFPLLERLRYEGRAYFSAGLELVKKGDLKGVIYLFVGIAKYPLRFDLVHNIYKSIKKSLG